MAPTVASRNTAQTALATLLRSGLVGTGKPCEAVYDEPPILAQQRIYTVVEASKAASEDSDMDDGTKSVFGFNIHNFSYRDNNGPQAKLNTLLHDETVILKENSQTGNWEELEISGESAVDLWQEADNSPEYWHEAIPVLVTMRD